jgi:hypothetical protein
MTRFQRISSAFAIATVTVLAGANAGAVPHPNPAGTPGAVTRAPELSRSAGSAATVVLLGAAVMFASRRRAGR